jgi:nucleoside diphosphate-linked moiety X motif protein 19
MTNSLWRNAATLLLAVRNSTPSNSAKYDYKLLMMKRSRKSKFMPSAVVFPGGVTEKSDFCPTWKQLLEPVKPLKRLMLQGVPRPMIMSAFPGLLEPDIGFRINAIREMFEETGILLHLATEDDVRADEELIVYDVSQLRLYAFPAIYESQTTYC